MWSTHQAAGGSLWVVIGYPQRSKVTTYETMRLLRFLKRTQSSKERPAEKVRAAACCMIRNRPCSVLMLGVMTQHAEQQASDCVCRRIALITRFRRGTPRRSKQLAPSCPLLAAAANGGWA